MGICTTKNEKVPLYPEQQYLSLLNIENPLNVNRKYSNYFILHNNKFTGSGIKRTHQYTSRLSHKEFIELRNQFWEKKADTWQIIKQALEEQIEELALKILSQHNLHILGGSIQLLYDETQQGSNFQVPIFLINEPQEWSQFDANVILYFETISLKVKIKSTKLPPEFEMKIKSISYIAQIKQQILEASKEKQCRLFYNGRELLDVFQIGNYGIVPGSIISAFI